MKMETMLSEGRMKCFIKGRTVLKEMVNMFMNNEKLKQRIHELYPDTEEESLVSSELFETSSDESIDEKGHPTVFSVREDLMTVSNLVEINYISLANHKYSRRKNGKQFQ